MSGEAVERAYHPRPSHLLVWTELGHPAASSSGASGKRTDARSLTQDGCGLRAKGGTPMPPAKVSLRALAPRSGTPWINSLSRGPSRPASSSGPGSSSPSPTETGADKSPRTWGSPAPPSTPRSIPSMAGASTTGGSAAPGAAHAYAPEQSRGHRRRADRPQTPGSALRLLDPGPPTRLVGVKSSCRDSGFVELRAGTGPCTGG